LPATEKHDDEIDSADVVPLTQLQADVMAFFEGSDD
jgi:hypothetical protein